MDDRLVMSRVVRREDAGRDFDIEFWQTLGDAKMLQLFADEAVRFLVVGGYEVIKHTEPYYTKDLDIWIEGTPENAARALRALRRFGAPANDVTIEDLTSPDLIYQIGVEPVRAGFHPAPQISAKRAS